MKNVIITLAIISMFGTVLCSSKTDSKVLGDKDRPTTIADTWETIIDANTDWQSSRPSDIVVPRKL